MPAPSDKKTGNGQVVGLRMASKVHSSLLNMVDQVSAQGLSRGLSSKEWMQLVQKT